MKYELGKVKEQLKGVAEYATQQSVSFRDSAVEMVQRVTHEAELMATNHQLAVEKVRHDYEYGVVLRLEEEKKEVALRWEMKAKEMTMEFMSLIADKDNCLQKATEKEASLQHRVEQMGSQAEQQERAVREAVKKTDELKDVISKMNSRVSEAERSAATATNELEYHKR